MQRAHLIVSDGDGNYFEVHGILAAGMPFLKPKCPHPDEMLELEDTSRLKTLTGRVAIGFDPDLDRFVQVREHRGQRVYPVAANLPLNHLQLYRSAYSSVLDATRLTDTSCTAVGAQDGKYAAAAVHLGASSSGDANTVIVKATELDRISALLGKDSESISLVLNSFQARYFDSLHSAAGANFDDLLKSIDILRTEGRMAPLTYSVFPGLTDHPSEFEALENVLKELGQTRITVRNLQVDPEWYLDELNLFRLSRNHIGMPKWLSHIQSLGIEATG